MDACFHGYNHWTEISMDSVTHSLFFVTETTWSLYCDNMGHVSVKGNHHGNMHPSIPVLFPPFCTIPIFPILTHSLFSILFQAAYYTCTLRNILPGAICCLQGCCYSINAVL